MILKYKKKIDKLNLKTFVKDIIKQSKRQAIDWQKILTEHTSRTYKEFSKLK